ncbi:MAG: HAMP domain-containing sensor histidine kinase [Myxococcota bacterium]
MSSPLEVHRAPDAEALRRRSIGAALGRLVRTRAILAPAVGGVALVFVFFEPTFWRQATLVVVVGMLWLVSLIEWLRARRGHTVHLPFNLVTMLLFELGVVVATGGLFSPLIPPLIVMSVVGTILGNEKLIRIVQAAVIFPAIWILAWAHSQIGLMPAFFGDTGDLETGPAPWAAAGAYTIITLVATRLGRAIRGGFSELVEEALRDRDQRLLAHAEQTRALHALSAEIAHELKNPLASVKGLGALVARDVDGKTGERVSVLRREVDRMQGVLEELLDFSRPLVPLAMEEVELSDLVGDVVRLHEGAAAERKVALRVEASPRLQASCDPRKLRQVLINLVQNALEASPVNGEVVIRMQANSPVKIMIEDQGRGLAPAVRERLFEAGVTTKEKGSGIGLAVARALARQHGGDVELEASPDGGCLATITLPRRPKAGGAT